MNHLKLKGRIIEHGMTMDEFSKAVGIARSTLWRKMKHNGFTVDEMNKSVAILHLSPNETMEIFFNNSCTNATEDYDEDS